MPQTADIAGNGDSKTQQVVECQFRRPSPIGCFGMMAGMVFAFFLVLLSVYGGLFAAAHLPPELLSRLTFHSVGETHDHQDNESDLDESESPSLDNEEPSVETRPSADKNSPPENVVNSSSTPIPKETAPERPKFIPSNNPF